METMTQEDKELLFKDLCARLPYGVKVLVDNKTWCDFDGRTPSKITFDNSYRLLFLGTALGYVKPYLFPLSSMTEEQRREYTKAQSDDGDIVFSCAIKYVETGADIVSAEYHATDWLNAHHFDYRGLIEKGLAIDATELNVY